MGVGDPNTPIPSGCSSKLPIAVCPGDPAGVGPEVVLAAIKANPDWHDRLLVIGPGGFLAQLPTGIATCDVGAGNLLVGNGQPTPRGQTVALAAMEAAARACIDGRASAVVTGPINKARMAENGFGYPGQTEFFGARWGGEPTMAFSGERMNVVLASWHLPLAQVPKFLTPVRLRQAIMHADWLARMSNRTSELLPGSASGPVPNIAVCGLNPHAGEDGLLGSEEKDWINGCLNDLRRQYPGLSGTVPGDTAFVRHLRGEFDVVVALYHDQGLAPLKTVEFDQAVNLTLGLPWLRTSPDHGTAYAIAGTGRADFRSMQRAMRLALEWG